MYIKEMHINMLGFLGEYQARKTDLIFPEERKTCTVSWNMFLAQIT